ncbi:MAG: FHA domain-containing protein [Gemmataceae bacterium]|nr:FHA domain-containing protein [Gemmataceae bacterium]
MTPRLLEPGKAGERIREIAIPGEEFLLGRGPECDLRLHDSATSRRHCLIRVRGDEATLADLGSSNGTFVNGARVLSQSVLHTGDEIRVGELLYIVDLGDDPAWTARFLRSDVDPVATTSRFPPREGGSNPHIQE